MKGAFLEFKNVYLPTHYKLYNQKLRGWVRPKSRNGNRIKLLEEEHARHQIICNPELHSGLYGRKRAQPRRTATKRRKISSHSIPELVKTEPKPTPTNEQPKFIPPIQVLILSTNSIDKDIRL